MAEGARDAFADLIAGGHDARPARDFEGLAIDRRSIAEQVANRILSLIKSGNLKSGDKLPTEQQMTVALGISRPALREALKALTVLGVLESRQGGRYTVTDLSPERLIAPLQFLMFVQNYDVDVHFEARACVDLELVRLAAERATGDMRERIARLAADGKAFLADPVGFRVLDFEFHRTINEAAANPLLKTMAEGLYDIALDIRRLATELPGVIAVSVDDHLRIADGIQRAAPGDAAAAYRAHLVHTRETTERALKAIAEAWGADEAGTAGRPALRF